MAAPTLDYVARMTGATGARYAAVAAEASPDTETAALVRHSCRLRLRLAEEATEGDHGGAYSAAGILEQGARYWEGSQRLIGR